MDFKITDEKIKETAARYGLVVSFDEEPGLYIGEEKIELEDLFCEFLSPVVTESSEKFTIPISVKNDQQLIQVEGLETGFKTEHTKEYTVGAA